MNAMDAVLVAEHFPFLSAKLIHFVNPGLLWNHSNFPTTNSIPTACIRCRFIRLAVSLIATSVAPSTPLGRTSAVSFKQVVVNARRHAIGKALNP
jgi:hypothetical protein